jgi:hypothetical protein
LLGVSVGLVMSAFAASEVTATALVPLVVVVFILLGGFIRSYDEMSPAWRWAAACIPTRWGYEAMIQAERLSHKPLAQERARELRVFLDESQVRAMASGQLPLEVPVPLPSIYRLQRFRSEDPPQTGSQPLGRHLTIDEPRLAEDDRSFLRKRIAVCMATMMAFLVVLLPTTWWRLRRD